jgi:uncharacterized protein
MEEALKFGNMILPFALELENLQVKVTDNEGLYAYWRDCQGSEKAKLLMMKKPHFLIAPVEPVNLPRQVASHLMIEFGREIMLEAEASQTIYLTFPIEIGVFVGRKEKNEILDVFTLTNPKYTLYGEPRNGFICKYWKSLVHTQEPQPNPLYEGVVRLDLHNSSRNWVFVNKAMFNAVGMKIFYNEKCVSMKAQMKIIEEEVAELEFLNLPLYRDMKKSPELFTLKRLSVASKKAVMLEGI